MKRRIRGAALGGFLAYVLLGALSYTHTSGAASLEQVTGLPMASWTVSEIEARNREQLVSASNQTGLQLATALTEDAPERLLPDLRPLEPSDLSTVGSRAESNLRLKFTTTIWNAGAGPLETRGAVNPQTDELEVYQYVYTGAVSGAPDGTAEQGQRVGTFNYDHRHGHLHFDGFARYELRRVGEGGALLEVVADNAKVGFCLMDIKHMDSGATHLESGLIEVPGGPVYAGCRDDVQGISVGWGDEYLSLLYEQDLDLSGVESGSYALVITANPDGSIEELDYDNNASVTYLTLEDEQVVWNSQEEADDSLLHPTRTALSTLKPKLRRYSKRLGPLAL